MLTRRQWINSAAAAAGAPVAAAAQRPNVLLIMTDQHRSDALGAYGNQVIRTPNLDLLAQNGTRFTNDWAQHPVCMPSRSSIFTGRYPSAHGVRANGIPLPRSEVTMAHAFRRAGYRTGGAGKFHFIPHFNRELPTMDTHPDPYYGFSEFHLGEDGRRGEQARWIKSEHPQYAGKPDHEIPIELHNSYWSASKTIDFIRDCSNRREPFFAFCSFVDPHHPYDPPSPYREMYKEADMPAPLLKDGEHENQPPFYKELVASFARMNERAAYRRTQYYGEISLIDDSVGRVLKALDEFKARENTLIVFTSDHGDVLGDHGIWYKGPYHYRSCANVPLIVNWPGTVKAGRVVDNIVQEIDIFPTIADLTGIPLPPGIQGRSQKPALTGASSDTGYDSALIEFGVSGVNLPGLPHPSGAPDLYTLVTRKWRMSYYPGKPYGELYNFEDDPHEFVNRWGDPGLEKERRDLKDQLLDRVLLAHDPLPVREDSY